MPRPIGTIDMHRGRWRVRLTLPDGTRRPFLAPDGYTREQAEEWRGALLADMRGTALDPSIRASRSVGAWAMSWLDARERTHRDADGDRQRWRCYWAEDPIAIVSLRALTPTALLEAGERLADRRLARQTTRNAWTTLRACLRAAVRARELTAERCAELLTVELPPLDHDIETETEERWTWLSLEEIERVLALEMSDAARAAFLVGIFTGLRAGELHALRWSDVHVAAHIPHVFVARSRKRATKAGRVGRVRLLEPAIGALRWYAGRCGVRIEDRPDALLWPGAKGSMHARGYDWGWPTLRARAGVRADVTWHDATRHTCASHLLQGTWCAMGWTDRPLRLEEVSTWLRHSDIGVTQRYAHLSLESLPVTAGLGPEALRSQRSHAARLLARLGAQLAEISGDSGSRPRELNPGPTVYETGHGAPRLLAIRGGGTAVGPHDLATEMLAALADGDGVRVEQLALRLASAVLAAGDADRARRVG
jgi:integrase